MLDKEAVLQIVENYQEFDFESLTIEKTTKAVIASIMEKCTSGKHFEERIEYYDNEDNCKSINWIDVEGETYGWLHLRNEDMAETLRDRFKSYLEVSVSEDEFVITIKVSPAFTIFHFIERDSYMQDHVYVVSDSEISY